MTGYVDGFVLPVPKKKLGQYRKLCTMMGKLMTKYGALEYLECVGDELGSKWGSMPFPKMAGAKKGETVIFSFITYKNKAQRNAIMAKMLKDPLMNDPKWKDMQMPFDMKRFAYGGFKVVVSS